MVLFIRFNSCNRTSQVRLLSATITDYNDILKNLRIILQYYYYIRSSLYLGILVANISYSNVCTLFSFQYEITVEISDGSGLCAVYAYCCADNGFACSIFHMAFYVNLSKGAYR